MSDEKKMISEKVEKEVCDMAQKAVQNFDGVELVDVSFYKQYGKLND